MRLLIDRTNGRWSNIGKKDFSETRLQCRYAKKLRNQLIFYGCTDGTFEQLVCPRRGAFAGLFSKNANDPRRGGGGGGGWVGALL